MRVPLYLMTRPSDISQGAVDWVKLLNGTSAYHASLLIRVA